MYNKVFISRVLRIIAAAIFLETLYYKFTAHPDSVYIFTQLGLEPWGRIGLGVVELIIASLILIPKTQVIGMVSGFFVISGAVFSHLLYLGINVRNDGGKLFLLAVIVFIASFIYLVINRKAIRFSIKNTNNGK